MVTTFERLAKVLKGYIKPANWIERAFASVGSAVLPSVSASDNGKFLGVNNGTWSTVDAPSGGGGMLVTLSGQNEQADKTFGEIAAALQSGIRPITKIYACYVPFYVSVYDEEKQGWVCAIDISILGDETPYKISINTNATEDDYPEFAGVQ